MDDSCGVRRRDGVDDREDAIGNLGRRHGMHAQHVTREIIAVDERHHEIRHTLVIALVEYLDDIGMNESRQGARLTEEARCDDWVTRQVRVQHLDCREAPVSDVTALVDTGGRTASLLHRASCRQDERSSFPARRRSLMGMEDANWRQHPGNRAASLRCTRMRPSGIRRGASFAGQYGPYPRRTRPDALFGSILRGRVSNSDDLDS
jgi:hypothetical protein